MRIELHFGDITEYNADCIVNAARPSLLGGGGVDGSIHRKAGTELKEFCKKLNGCAVGEVKISPAFNLPCKHIIHTVGPRYLFQSESEKEDLKNCYLNALNIAKEYEFKTLVFPNISTGAYGFPKDIASNISFETVVSFLLENLFPEKVIFCCYDIENLELYLNLIKQKL